MEEKFGIVIEAVTTGFKAKMNEIKNLGQQTSNSIKQSFSQMKITPTIDTSNLAKSINQTKGLSQALKQTHSFDVLDTGVLDVFNNKISTATGNITLLKNNFKLVKPEIEQATKETKKMVSAQEKLKRSSNSIKGMGLNFKNMGINVSKLGNSFQNAINKVKRFGLALLSVRGIYSLLSKASQAYMAFDTDLSNKLQSAWAGLGAQLAPIIEFIINLFAKAVAYVNAFIKALTGINLIARANTKALNKQAGAAKSTTKALSSIDEITNIQRDTGGGGGGGGDTPQIELPKVDTSKLEEFAKTLKDLFKQGKYFEMGEMIGQKLNESLEKIEWEKIKRKAGNIGKGLAEFINGGIQGTNWALVGNTIAQSLNTAIEFAYNFVETFDFKEFGKAMGELFYNTFHNIDWAKLGQTITDGIAGVFDTISGFLQNVDWGKLVQDLETFAKNIDWGKIAKSMWEALGSALGALISIVGQSIVNKARDIANYFKSWIDESKKQGGSVIEGLLAGILHAMDDIGKWIINNIFKPFIDGFKNAFGIHSPSTVMEEQGNLIVDGLKQGLSGIWNSVKGIITDLINKIKDKFRNVGVAVGEAVSGAVKNAINKVLNGAVRIINGFISSINGIISLINAIPGVKLSKLNKLSVPQLATGTNYVPEDQLAYIHKGEAVVPKKFNSAEYFSNINDNQETNALLLEVNKTLIEIREKDTTLNINGKELARTTYNDFRNEGNRLGQSSVVNVR